MTSTLLHPENKIASLKQIETEVASVYLKSEGLVVIEFKSEIHAEIDAAVEVSNAVLQLSQNNPVYVLVCAANIQSSMNNQAMRYLAKNQDLHKVTRAVAFVLNNLPIRITVNTFIRVHKPPYPTKIFKTKENALDWLNSFEF